MARNTREAHLEGAQVATRLHRELDVKGQVNNADGNVRVFQAIDQRGYGLLFRPLDGLLGLCVKDPYPGVLISTNRSLSVQRYTAAHELGHLEMGHDFSFDDDQTIWQPRGTSQKELQEVSANAFGAAFLMPKWLLKEKMLSHGWDGKNLTIPGTVYQLSLRLGVSYEALCRTLIRYQWVLPPAGEALLSATPKQLKIELLNGQELENPWADVWLLSETDHGEFIEAGPSDVFVLKLTERGNGGYLWNIKELNVLGFNVHTHDPAPEFDPGSDIFGSSIARCWKITSDAPTAGNVALEERRPWQREDVTNRLEFKYSLWGKEAGLPRFQRPLFQAA